MSDPEKEFVKKLYKAGTIRLLVVIFNMSWSIDDLESHIVVLLDAERFDGHEHRSIEYSIPDVLQMIGRANVTISKGSNQAS